MKMYREGSFSSEGIVLRLSVRDVVNMCSVPLSLHPPGELPELEHGRSKLGWDERLPCLLANEELCCVMNGEGDRVLDTNL